MKIMSTQQKARALMVRNYQIIKNRQQSMLERTAAEIGLDIIQSNSNNLQGTSNK